MPKGDVTVDNIPANQRALKQAGELDTVRAGTEAARDMLPFIEAETRVGETGRLRAAWRADDSAFINETDYAAYQEFGTVSIEPMGAIQKAVDRREETLRRPFEKESERAADKAGLGS